MTDKQDIVERLDSVYGNLTPGAIETADLDGMAFDVREAATEIEALRERVRELEGVAALAAAACEVAMECAGIEWAELIKRSKRGEEDDDEQRKESKAMVYGLLEEAAARTRQSLNKGS